MAVRTEDTSFFCVLDGFDYHRPAKMVRGEQILFVVSLTFLALLKVPEPIYPFLFMGEHKEEIVSLRGNCIFNDHNI